MSNPEMGPSTVAPPETQKQDIIPIGVIDVSPNDSTIKGLRGLVREHGFRDGFARFRLARTEHKIGALEEDLDFYSVAATKNIGRRKYGDTGDLMTDIQSQISGTRAESSTHDPLSSFHKKHRSSRTGFGFTTDTQVGYPAVDLSSGARTWMQRQHEVRQTRRIDAINSRALKIKNIVNTYGDVDILDKDTREAQIKTGRYSRGQRKAIRAAGRQARKNLRSLSRIDQRIHRSEDNNDLPGTVLGVRINHSINKANRIERNIINRENRRADRRNASNQEQMHSEKSSKSDKSKRKAAIKERKRELKRQSKFH